MLENTAPKVLKDTQAFPEAVRYFYSYQIFRHKKRRAETADKVK
jgi:hypothetical protein